MLLSGPGWAADEASGVSLSVFFFQGLDQDEGFTDVPKLIAEEDVDFLPYISWSSTQPCEAEEQRELEAEVEEEEEEELSLDYCLYLECSSLSDSDVSETLEDIELSFSAPSPAPSPPPVALPTPFAPPPPLSHSGSFWPKKKRSSLVHALPDTLSGARPRSHDVSALASPISVPEFLAVPPPPPPPTAYPLVLSSLSRMESEYSAPPPPVALSPPLSQHFGYCFRSTRSLSHSFDVSALASPVFLQSPAVAPPPPPNAYPLVLSSMSTMESKSPAPAPPPPPVARPPPVAPPPPPVAPPRSRHSAMGPPLPGAPPLIVRPVLSSSILGTSLASPLCGAAPPPPPPVAFAPRPVAPPSHDEECQSYMLKRKSRRLFRFCKGTVSTDGAAVSSSLFAATVAGLSRPVR